MFLGGEGGTGKSRIFEALLYFGKCCNRPGAICTFASTVISASLINDVKLHSMSKLKGESVFIINQTHTQDSIDMLSGVTSVILHEFSMMSRKFLVLFDVYLFNAGKEFKKSSGGIMMICCGDFFKYHR